MARYEFGDCTLDLQCYEFTRAGVAVHLGPQVFNVLAYLVQHCDRVVSKQELFDHLWPDRFVTDDALGRCIRAARRALGEDVDNTSYIQTLRGRGYRFIAPVVTDGQAKTVQPLPTPYQPNPQEAMAASIAADGEYKQVTMLGGCLSNGPTLAGQLGPEAMHRLMQTIFAMIQDVVRRYDGSMVTFGTDDFLALFGAPVAQENHAHRAVLAALSIVEGLSYLDRAEWAGNHSATVHPEIGIGLHTGRVVVGQLAADGQPSYTASGEISQIASHLKQIASPGGVLISPALYQLTQEQLHVEVVDPMPPDTGNVVGAIYRVVGRKLNPVVTTGRRGPGQSPFTGRERELDILHQCLNDIVLTGRGQVLSLLGEPGLGKSRLLAEFRQEISDKPIAYYEGHCLSYGDATPYLPVLDVLRQLCGIVEVHEPEAIAAKIRQRLQDAYIVSEEAQRLLLWLLDVHVKLTSSPSLNPDVHKESIFAILRQLLLDEAHRRPVVLAIENLQWTDATSEQWFISLVQRLAGNAILILVTHRPGYHPAWMAQSTASQVSLSRLDPQSSLEIVRYALQNTQVSNHVLQDILHQADGNPFFLEELARDVREHQGYFLDQRVPQTIEAVLASRIDRLAPWEKRLLQTGAIIGMDIALPLLQAVTGWSQDDLSASLNHLQTAEFLLETRSLPETTYTFKHALTREVAYQSLLAHTRRLDHQRIAETLTAEFADVAQTQPEVVAHHYTEAGLLEMAVPYWYQAGLRAQERLAHREAIRHLCKGLELLKSLPDSEERDREELNLQFALSPSLVAIEGYAPTIVGNTYLRAKVLSQREGTVNEQGRVLVGLWAFYSHRGDLETAFNVATQLFDIAQSVQERLLLADAYRMLGYLELHFGNLQHARPHLEEALAIYDTRPSPTAIPLGLSGLHPKLFTLAWLAKLLWLLGDPNQAMVWNWKALALSDDLEDPFNRVSALGYSNGLYQLCGDWQTAQQQYEEAMALTAQYDLAQDYLIADNQYFYLQIPHLTPRALSQLHEYLDVFRAKGGRIRLPMNLAYMAEAYGCGGQVEIALAILSDAIRQMQYSGERWWEPEVYRLRGELMLAPDNPQPHLQEAEASFTRALTVAREQGAKSWELRAAISMSRLWRDQGNAEAARQLLVPLYAGFNDRRATTDLQAAKALVAELMAK